MHRIATLALLTLLYHNGALEPMHCECLAPEANGSNLALLNCSSEAIDSLKENIPPCTVEIQAIDASHNLLESVECIDKWILTEVKLSHNRLQTVADCFLQQNLTKLDVSWNELKTLNLEGSTKLNFFRADNNLLEDFKLPYECSLKELNVTNNRLVVLPDTIVNCTDLYYLGASNNSINELSAGVLELMKLPKLFQEREHDTLLDLSNNPLPAAAVVTSIRQYAQSQGHLQMYLDSGDCECAILKNDDENLRRVKICVSSMCGDDINYWTVV